MTAGTALLPYRWDESFRPGQAYAFRTSGGEAGWADDYDFTFYFGGDEIDITEDDGQLLFTISAEITAAHPEHEGAVPIVIEEADLGVRVVGSWVPSLAGTESPSNEVPIVLVETIEIPVTLLLGPAAGESGGGVTDHGALTGLTDDDHPQYHNNARGDARYDALGAASAAQAAAIQRGNHTGAQAIATITGLQAALDLLAPLLSPALTGSPTSTTPGGADNSTRIATTAFVITKIAELVDGAPELLNTFAEIAAALEDDDDALAALTAAIAAKVSDEGYDQATWNGVAGVAPSKNAVRDAIEAIYAHLISTYVALPASPLDGDILVYDEATGEWVAASATPQYLIPSDFVLSAGTPDLAAGTSRQRWAFDATSAERVTSAIWLPRGWVTADVDLIWTVSGATPLVTRWSLRTASDAIGDVSSASVTAHAAVNASSPAQYVVAVTTLKTALAVDPDARLVVEIERAANNAADTQAGDAWLYGVRIRRAS